MKIQCNSAVFVCDGAFYVRHISCEQLENLGVDELAYVKQVMTESGPEFAIHAADGRQLGVATTEIVAAAAIIQEGMLPHLVH